MISMDGREFISVAADLVKGKSEAHWRSAVSRAYYGVFHGAKELLARKKSVRIMRGSGAHGELRTWLLNQSDDELVRAGSDLGDLHSQRLRADYDVARRVIRQQDAVLELAKARAIMRAIEGAV